MSVDGVMMELWVYLCLFQSVKERHQNIQRLSSVLPPLQRSALAVATRRVRRVASLRPQKPDVPCFQRWGTPQQFPGPVWKTWKNHEKASGLALGASISAFKTFALSVKTKGFKKDFHLWMWMFGRHSRSLICGLARQNYQLQMNTSILNYTFILSLGLRTGKTTASAGAVTRWIKITSARSRTHLETWDKYRWRPLWPMCIFPLSFTPKVSKPLKWLSLQHRDCLWHNSWSLPCEVSNPSFRRRTLARPLLRLPPSGPGRPQKCFSAFTCWEPCFLLLASWLVSTSNAVVMGSSSGSFSATAASPSLQIP